MRSVFFAATALFWLAFAALWAIAGLVAPADPALAQSADRVIAPAELAKHSGAKDCWMAIGGSVYDLSAYLPQHPTPPSVVTPWCGRDGTEAYRTKNRGRPHSAYADELLSKYRVGTLSR